MRTASNLTALEHIGSARNAFADLEHWLYSHTSTTHKLHTIEVEQERRGREVLRLMLQAHIDSRGDGCVGDGLVGNPQGSSEEIVYRHKRLRSRRLITVFGPVSITRMEYSSRGQHSLYPLDAVLGLPARSYSYEIQRRLVKAAVKRSEEHTSELQSPSVISYAVFCLKKKNRTGCRQAYYCSYRDVHDRKS